MNIRLNSKRNKSGFIWIVISILVLIVGGIIIYQLARLLHNLNTTHNEVQVGYSNGQDGIVWYLAKPVTPTLPPGVTPDNVTPADLTTNSFCTFQYRVMVDSNNVASSILVMGTNMVDGRPIVLIDNTNEYEITFVIAGQNYVLDTDAVTGDTISETISPLYQGNPYTAIVQRSTNGVTWDCVFTNDPCEVGVIYTYTDPSAPVDHACYRLAMYPQP